MNSIVLATAGHVDHGKTALLHALTGVNTDRLPEEQRRNMTIDVGYAFLQLEDGSEVDFVDVPGHEDLLSNMIVGVAEADAFLLAVDATEGIRAQTVEHVDVLGALGVHNGIAVVTKTDLAERAQTALVINNLRSVLTRHFGSPTQVLAASNRTLAGLIDVKRALRALLSEVGRDPDAVSNRHSGPPVLPIDRVFTVAGRGRVVTGTLRGGMLREGQLLCIEPGSVNVRVAELQRHGDRVEQFSGSGRVAVRLRGLGRVELKRGMILAAPGAVQSGRSMLIAQRSHSRVLRRSMHLTVHVGTTRAQAVVARTWQTDEGTLAGLRLRDLVAVIPNTQLVVRHGSSVDGARLIDVALESWRGVSPVTADRVARSRGSRARIEALLELRHVIGKETLAPLVGFQSHPDVSELTDVGVDAGPLWLSSAFEAFLHEALVGWTQAAGSLGLRDITARQRIAARVGRKGIHQNDAVKAAVVILDRLVERGYVIRRREVLFHPSAFESVTLDASAKKLVALLTHHAPPRLREAIAAAGCSTEIATALERHGDLVRVSGEIAYAFPTYRSLVDLTCRLAKREPVRPSQLREAGNVSRRHAIALLEHLDSSGVLVRTPLGHTLVSRPTSTPASQSDSTTLALPADVTVATSAGSAAGDGGSFASTYRADTRRCSRARPSTRRRPGAGRGN